MAATARGSVRPTDRALADALFDSYLDWRETEEAVQAAYRSWTGAGPPDPDASYRYSAALDQEERAAKRYQELSRRSSA